MGNAPTNPDMVQEKSTKIQNYYYHNFFLLQQKYAKKKKIPHQAINTWNDWGKKVVSRENKHKKITFVPTNHQIRE